MCVGRHTLADRWMKSSAETTFSRSLQHFRMQIIPCGRMVRAAWIFVSQAAAYFTPSKSWRHSGECATVSSTWSELVAICQGLRLVLLDAPQQLRMFVDNKAAIHALTGAAGVMPGWLRDVLSQLQEAGLRRALI
eukprot:6186779-Amphidinium_carterae.1